ncbi:MAG: hypothetical protein IIC81_03880 [Chloroflexi bacterium]|nr:hypothetical protein [Chloroflexota bacterium]
MPEEESLEGWIPELGHDLSLGQVIDLAFDYRGNITIVKADGDEIVGYIFNRDSDVSEPYIEYFDKSGNGPFSLLYSEIGNIRFTGKDTAAGQSWEAWQKRKEAEKARG